MYEFFLRVYIRIPLDATSLRSDEPLRAVLDTVKAELRELRVSPLDSSDSVRGDVVVLNGIPILIATGIKNHDNGMSSGLVKLLEQLAAVAALSEGMLWTRDEASGNWQVYTLKNGTVSSRVDPWFSTGDS